MSTDLIRRGKGSGGVGHFAAADRIFRPVGETPPHQHGQISLLMFPIFFPTSSSLRQLTVTTMSRRGKTSRDTVEKPFLFIYFTLTRFWARGNVTRFDVCGKAIRISGLVSLSFFFFFFYVGLFSVSPSCWLASPPAGPFMFLLHVPSLPTESRGKYSWILISHCRRAGLCM